MKEIILPKLGEGIIEATLTRWLKKEGDYVAKHDILAEISTDKVDSEVVSEYEGYLHDLRFNINNAVPVGDVIAVITDSASAPSKETVLQEEHDSKLNTVNAGSNVAMADVAKEKRPTERKSNIPLRKAKGQMHSPVVRRMITMHAISEETLAKIKPTGRGGRLVKNDIEQYLASQSAASNTGSLDSKEGRELAAMPTINNSVSPTVTSLSNREQKKQAATEDVLHVEKGDEVQPMGRMRKLIADHMMHSIQTSAHVTMFSEADVTTLVEWKKRNAPIAQSSYDTKLTYTPLFVRALANALQKYPVLNSSITSNNEVVYRKNVHIGIATALPTGDLIVPVIRDAINYNLLGLAKECNRLVEAARSKKLKPTETQNGTFTITNIGTFGCLTGTPIINQPQVAILAVGAIKKRPCVVQSEDGDAIAVRHILSLSLSFDHRIIDGALGGMFLQEMVKQLEEFNPSMSIT